MGCASSSPLVESGKTFVDTAKESAEDVIEKGEKTIQGGREFRDLRDTILYKK